MYKGLLADPMPLLEKEKQNFFDGVLDIEIAEKKDEVYLIENIAKYDVLLIALTQVSRKVIEAAENLKVIVRYGIGTDNIDLEAATEKGVVVTYCPEYHMPTVPEHVIALMFSMARFIPSFSQSVKDKQWDFKKYCGVDIENKTLGILGFGQIGNTVAKKALALGMEVVAYDPFLKTNLPGQEKIQLKDYEDVVRQADFLSVNVPLTENTENLINEDTFKKMKEGSFLINTSRGAVVDEQALIDALKTKKIAGAALDVLREEPPSPDNELLNFDNVIITPHTAGVTAESLERLEMTAAKSAVDVLQGSKPKFVRNPEVLSKLNLK